MRRWYDEMCYVISWRNVIRRSTTDDPHDRIKAAEKAVFSVKREKVADMQTDARGNKKLAAAITIAGGRKKTRHSTNRHFDVWRIIQGREYCPPKTHPSGGTCAPTCFESWSIEATGGGKKRSKKKTRQQKQHHRGKMKNIGCGRIVEIGSAWGQKNSVYWCEMGAPLRTTSGERRFASGL